MKNNKFFLICVLSLILTNCSHKPYDNFHLIQIGQDKESVLNQIGSPLRSRRVDNKDIWTYRFFYDTGYIYKEIQFDHQKIVSIEDAKQIQIEEIEKKEKKIEEALRNNKNNPRVIQKKNSEKSFSTDFLDQTSGTKKGNFEPVE